MPDLRFYTEYIIQLGATRVAKTLYSVSIGVLGTLILVAFLTSLLPAASISRLLPLIIGFNAALTGYNLIEKTRNGYTHKRLAALTAGLAVVAGAAVFLNLLFWKLAGSSLIGMEQLLMLLPVGIITSGLGGVLAVRYLKLS